MKASKMLIVSGEMMNEAQIASSKDAFLRGIEEIGKRRLDLVEIVDQLSQKDIEDVIELDTCIVELLIDVDKTRLLKAVKEGHCHETLLILYVGPVTAPWGHWLLSDGIVTPSDILPAAPEEHCKVVVATMAPCDDWLFVEKKQGSQLTICNYDIAETIDPVALGLCDFIDAVCHRLKVTPCNIKRPESMSFLKASQPSVCGFLDKGCSAMPCLFLIDGFSMLFNLGYGRNPEVRHQLKYIAQLDAALLSHAGYNNILALSCAAQSPESVKINHLFLPYGVNMHDKSICDSENPFIVNLNCEISKVLSGFKERGTSVSNLSIKGKSGSSLTSAQVKPIQLFHKIGYGSLELIALAPFEDDPEVKKCSDDLKKGKYFNESQNRSLPTSVSVLLLWKPFNTKIATKRLLYIGSKSQLRKNLPTVVTALYNNNECLKQTESSPIDGQVKKQAAPARKTPTAVTTVTTAKTSTKVNGTATEPIKKSVPAPPAANDKIPRSPINATDHAKKSGTQTSDKQSRPSTATGAGTQSKTKEIQATKRANTATKVKSAEATKTSDTKSSDSKKTAEIKKSEPNKIQDLKKVVAKPKTSGSKTTVKKTTVSKLEDVEKNATEIAAKTVHEDVVVANGSIDEHSKTDLVIDPLCHGNDVPSDSNKMVAVGTVECAITEHGEADFCDDTPEEYSAEQMKEMGLYDDDDEDRSSAPISDGVDLEGVENDVAATVPTNIAHLPMEGSFYGKDTFDEVKTEVWNEPLGMPPPPHARDGASATKKPTKCATPIHVDCLFVPSDLDKEDLRCLFNYVRFDTAFLQLEKSVDLIKSLDLLMEEWVMEGTTKEVTIMPNLEDESTLSWVEENMVRLSSYKIKVAPALSRCSILIGGGEGDNSCLGYRCDL